MKNSILIVAAFIAFTMTSINAQSPIQTTALSASSVEMISAIDLTDMQIQTELSQYLANHVQYPDHFVEYAIAGTSKVAITLNAYGTISSYKITESLGTLFDVEIHKALEKLERVSTAPNSDKGYTVIMPIRFTM